MNKTKKKKEEKKMKSLEEATFETMDLLMTSSNIQEFREKFITMILNDQRHRFPSGKIEIDYDRMIKAILKGIHCVYNPKSECFKCEYQKECEAIVFMMKTVTLFMDMAELENVTLQDLVNAFMKKENNQIQ